MDINHVIYYSVSSDLAPRQLHRRGSRRGEYARVALQVLCNAAYSGGRRGYNNVPIDDDQSRADCDTRSYYLLAAHSIV